MPGSNFNTDENKAKHRGRAYQCLRCLQTGKEVIDVKARVEDHLMKHHLSLDQVPFYCTLCLFKCKDPTTLKEHVKKFSRHALIAAEKGISPTMQETYLKKNPQPYQMGPEDYYILSTEESTQYFLQRSHQKKTSHQNQDLLSEAVQELCSPSQSSHGSLPEVVSKLHEPQVPSSTMEAGIPSEQLWTSFLSLFNQMQKVTPPSMTNSIQVQSSETATSCVFSSTPQLQPAKTVSTMWSPISSPTIASPIGVSSKVPGESNYIPCTATVSSFPFSSEPSQKPSNHGTTFQLTDVNPPPPVTFTAVSTIDTPAATATAPISDQHNSSGCLFRPWQESQLPDSVELQPQPEKNNNLPETETKSPTRSSDSPAVVENLLPQLLGDEEEQPPTTESKQQQGSDNFRIFEKLEDAIRTGNKILREEIEKNSRSIRCLTKNMEETNKTLTSIKDTLENLVSYLRTNAREERRRKERKEEERRKEREEDRRREEQSTQQKDRKRRREDSGENQSPQLKSVLGEVRTNKRRKGH